jgi:signal transduction histidine kinase
VRRVLRASPVTVGVAAVLVAVSVVAFFLFRSSDDHQETTLLRSDALQASVYVSSVFSGVGTLLDSIGTATTSASGSPAAFATTARQLTGGRLSVALAQHSGSGYSVVSAVGPLFRTGQALGPALSADLGRAGATMTPGPVTFDGHMTTFSFAVGPPFAPAGEAIVLELRIDPYLTSRLTTAKPFALLDVAVYGAPHADKGALLVANTRALPLAGSTVAEHVTMGTANWTLVAEARGPLTGGFARQAPFVILGLGLFVAALMAATAEVLVRRQRYAARAVAERTADLERTLEDLRTAQDALVRGERLSALGEMASIVGHELRNPLSAVTNALYLVRAGLGEVGDPLDRHLAMAERETAKAASLAEELTAFVRPGAPQKEPVALDQLVREVVEAAPPPAEVELEVEVEPLSVDADPRQLSEVLTNLITNAYQAVDGAGKVTVTAHMNGAGLELQVRDSGPGIAPELAERVFEPFFTTKHDGTGLGLAIVRRLVEAHGGEVAFEANGDGGGARAVVRLPTEPSGVPA